MMDKGKVKIKEDIHHGVCHGLVSRSEAIKNGYEVELIPYIEEGTYAYTEEDGIVRIHIDEYDDREFECDFEADWFVVE